MVEVREVSEPEYRKLAEDMIELEDRAEQAGAYIAEQVESVFYGPDMFDMLTRDAIDEIDELIMKLSRATGNPALNPA